MWPHLTLVLISYNTSKFQEKHPAHTRHKDGPILKKPIHHFSLVKSSPLYQTAAEWNSLPLDIRNINDSQGFKKIRWPRSVMIKSNIVELPISKIYPGPSLTVSMVTHII